MSNWQKFVDDLQDDAGVLAKDELKKLVQQGRADADAFVRAQAEDLERYLTQLAAGQITREEFEVNVDGLQTLTRMEKTRLSVVAKASAQRLVEGIENLIINGLLKLVF